MNVNPLLLDFPDTFETERLTLRTPHSGDGAMINAAVIESLAELRPWMPWAQTPPTLADSETYAREKQAQFLRREDLTFLLLRREDGRMIGSGGLHRIDWQVPRFEIGYWVRTGDARRGYITEAVQGLTTFARDHLGARRVEIRMDSRNERSGRIAERAGFALEGVIRHERRSVDGALIDGRSYARIF